MSRKMAVVFHNEDLYTYLKVEAAPRHKPASDIVAEAVEEWLDSREDAELLPSIETARSQWKEKGERPWAEVQWAGRSGWQTRKPGRGHKNTRILRSWTCWGLRIQTANARAKRIFEERALPKPNKDYSNICNKSVSLDKVLSTRGNWIKLALKQSGQRRMSNLRSAKLLWNW